MKNLNKDILVYILWGVVVIILILIFIFYFIIKNITVVNLLLGLLGVFAMLAIALHTFSKMDKTTREMITTIFKTSQKQIEELKTTNITLTSVAKSLKIISGDVATKQKQIPILATTFKNNQNEITLRAGEECQIEFWLYNRGVVSANNPTWRIFFPPQVKISNKGTFNNLVPQRQISVRYPGYKGLYQDLSTIKAKIYDAREVTVRTEKTNIGLVKVPYVCSADNVPEDSDELLINFIG